MIPGQRQTTLIGKVREKFATQINSEILAEVRAVAEAEGRQKNT